MVECLNFILMLALLNSDSPKPERPPSNVASTLLVALPSAASGVIIIAFTGTILTLMSLYRKARKHLDALSCQMMVPLSLRRSVRSQLTLLMRHALSVEADYNMDSNPLYLINNEPHYTKQGNSPILLAEGSRNREVGVCY